MFKTIFSLLSKHNNHIHLNCELEIRMVNIIISFILNIKFLYRKKRFTTFKPQTEQDWPIPVLKQNRLILIARSGWRKLIGDVIHNTKNILTLNLLFRKSLALLVENYPRAVSLSALQAREKPSSLEPSLVRLASHFFTRLVRSLTKCL